HLRGQDRWRVPARRHRGDAGHRHDGRAGVRGGRVSENDVEPDVEQIVEGGAEPGQEEAMEASLTSPARLTAYLRRGGVIVPILTTVIAFLAGGVVVLL